MNEDRRKAIKNIAGLTAGTVLVPSVMAQSTVGMKTAGVATASQEKGTSNRPSNPNAQTILITGAGSGLGLGTALGLAQQGHNVIASVEIWSQSTTVQKEAKKAGVDIEVIKLDVLSKDDRDYAASFDIDILVNNAGIGATGPIAEMPMHYFRQVMEVNTFAAIELTQLFAKKFVEKKAGKIVFLSSIAGLTTFPFLAPYHASKFALEAAAQCFHTELTPLGVRVCTINPGPYDTGFNDRMYDVVDQWYDPNVNFTPEKPIRDMQQTMASPGFQFDPKEMIDMMVKIIPMKEKHKFRIMLPEDSVVMSKEGQKKMWEMDV